MVFKTRINWKEELPVIKELGSMGWTQTSLAEKYGVSRQRIKQVVDKNIPDWYNNYGLAVNRKILAEDYFEKWGEKANTDLYKAQRQKYNRKKSNAQRTGYSWSLSFGDLKWPILCPILGMELDFFAETTQENSPSFDRIDSSLGYVKGNVQIISWRANRIKNNGTAEEHRKIATYLDSL